MSTHLETPDEARRFTPLEHEFIELLWELSQVSEEHMALVARKSFEHPAVFRAIYDACNEGFNPRLKCVQGYQQ